MLDLSVLISQTSDILVLEVYFTRNKRKEANGYSISSIYTPYYVILVIQSTI